MTQQQIEQLRTEATATDNAEQVSLCDLALEGDAGAIDACALALYAAEARR